jgi:GntR family transcriptional repressor for pyruvate dehydrogenase complex
MPYELKSVEREKLYLSIVDQILEGVRSGGFVPGSPLPPERVLAAQLSVSRASLREAIRVLEHAGVLEVRTGSGTYVSADAPSKGATLRTHAALAGEHSPLDILVARRAVEPMASRHAAMHRHSTDLRALHRAFEEHARMEQSGEDPEEPDLAFHLAIATASHNPVLVTLLQCLADIMRQGTWRDLRRQQLRHPGRGKDYVDQHDRILIAIEDGNADAADAAMVAHMDAIEAGVLAEV